MEPYSIVVSDSEQIPTLMHALPRWCCWVLQQNAAGKMTKVPDRSTVTGTLAQWKDVQAVERWSGGGIGFVFTGGVPVGSRGEYRMIALDLDACYSAGVEPAPAVLGLLELCGSYTEVSPSGHGLRVIVAVPVAHLGRPLKSKVRASWPAPAGVTKTPEVQVFGLGPAGYVAMTGDRIERSPEQVQVTQNWQRIVEMLGLEREEAPPLPEPEGDAPTAAAITAAVLAATDGDDLLNARWQKLGVRSASEAYAKLTARVVDICDGHLSAAVAFLVGSTAWGRGEVEDSADPGRYTREKWVRADVLRYAAHAPKKPKATAVFADLGDAPPAPAVAKAAKNRDPLAVLDSWEQDGPLVHLPTGIASLDLLTGGGFVLGSRVYCNGAPDAGKTLLMVQVADHYLRQGIPVCFHGVDEEPSDLLLRWLQRRGLTREECEQRSPATIAKARELLKGLPLLLSDSSSSVEESAVALHQFAKSLRPGEDRPACVLFVDSVQTARSSANDDNDTLYRSVTQRVAALRSCASRYRMLVCAASEMSRAAYAKRKVEDQIHDLASAKESGAIEFSARVLLVLRNVQGTSDMVELRVAKNKHGPSHRADQEGIFLRLNRPGQSFTEEVGFEKVDPISDQKAEEAEKMTRLCGRLAALLLQRDLGRNAAAGALGATNRDLEACRDWLVGVGAVTIKSGKNRQALMCLSDPKRLPPGVAEAMQRAL